MKKGGDNENCYKKDDVYSYTNLFNKIKGDIFKTAIDKIEKRKNFMAIVDNSIEMIFIHCNMIFNQTSCPDSSPIFFKKYCNYLEADSSSYTANKNCYYTIDNHMFLTISGPPVSSIANTGKQIDGCEEKTGFVRETDIITNTRADNYKNATATYSDVFTSDSTLKKSFEEFFNAIQELGIKDTETPGLLLKFILMLNDHMKTSYLLYFIQKFSPPVLEELYRLLMKNTNEVILHTYGWEWGGSAAIAGALILKKFMDLIRPDKKDLNKVFCRVLSPNPFLDKKLGWGADHTQIIESLDEANFNFAWIGTTGDMQINQSSDARNQFKNQNSIMLGKNLDNIPKSGHYTYTNKIDSSFDDKINFKFLSPNTNSILTVNIVNASPICADVPPVGGRKQITHTALKQLAKQYDIKGRSTMTKDELQTQVRKCQQKERRQTKNKK